MTRLLHQAFRLEPELIALLKRLARRERMTYSALVRDILRREVWVRGKPSEMVPAVQADAQEGPVMRGDRT
jgi:predicted transcriptional regulator